MKHLASPRRIASLFVFLVSAVCGTALQAAGPASGGNSAFPLWQPVDEQSIAPGPARPLVPASYRTVRLNEAALNEILARAPMEFTVARNEQPIITLPMPDGTIARFQFEESPIVEQALADKYPELKTYRGQGLDDPTATLRFDWLPTGFHAMILSPSGTVLIDPYATGDRSNYMTYWKRDAVRNPESFVCHVDGDEEVPPEVAGRTDAPAVISGGTLRTYRLALASTNEYAVAVGGNTKAGTLAAEVLIMNRVNGVYERDLSIRMVMIGNNDLITYAGDNTSCGGACTSANDPYTNNNGSTMLGQNQTTIDGVIGSANYDIGHVFSTGGGGIAQLAVVCGNSKAKGVTGLSNPVGDAFAIDYVAHEMGHQWAANHTFNGTSGSCGGGNRSNTSAYEPGSGITIMAYAGICSTQDLAAHSIDTFHVKSLEVIAAFSQTGGGNTCAASTSTGNTAPTVTGPGNFTIPKGTPFALTAVASDINGDAITYDWQEYDLDAGGVGTTAVPNTDSDGTPRPIFVPLLPTVGGTRTFPALTYILNNANVPPATTGGFLTGELLPAISRTMVFQVIARDNHASGGGINTATSTITVSGGAGPFAVTAPNTAVSVPALSSLNVTWNPANTAAAPVSAANVKISLSTDGGLTFPNVLAASTPNDGAQTVTLPNVQTTTARIKVEAVGNIFFDISDANFTITPAVIGGNADLSGLTISSGTLSPAFAPGTLAYTDVVTNATSSVTVAPTLADAGASVKVNGNTVASGTASAAIALAVGNGNVINVVVTAQDGITTKSYSITVTRAAGGSTNANLASLTISAGTLSPAFASGTISYTDSVSNATASLTVTPTLADGTASLTVNGSAVTSGSASAPIALSVGSGNVINVVVTAQDGVTTKTYTVTVTRAGVVGSGARFIALAPCRLVDTRAPGTYPISGAGQMTSGESRSFALPFSNCGIPGNAVAYSLNATVVPAGPLGWLTLWPSGQSMPGVSTLNSPDGRTKANAAIVPAGVGGAVSAFVTDATHLILDIDGYFVPAGAGGDLAFYPLAPCRISDTRSVPGTNGGPTLAGGETRNISTWNICGIPQGTTALSLNYTAIPRVPLGWLTTWAAGQAQPGVSTLNAPTGTVVANAAIVPTGLSGQVSIFVTNTADVVVDVNGYFAPAGSPGALSFFASTPCRIADTRLATGPFGGPQMAAGSTRNYAVPLSPCAIPATAQSYSLNATVVPNGALGWLTLWPAGNGVPGVSTLNAFDGAITSNAAFVNAGTGGSISAFVTDSTNLILDINGYFAP